MSYGFKTRRGFTLIEMLVVMAILVILGGMLMAGISSARNQAAIKSVQNTLTLLKAMLARYEDDYGDYPPSDGDSSGAGGAENLYAALTSEKKNGPYINSSEVKTCDSNSNRVLEIADYWNRPIRYVHHRDYGSRQPQKRTFRLISAGPNGQYEDGAKGSDDIVNWDKDNPDK